MGRIDCCHKCDRPIKSPYCHNVGVCPDYTRQREKLNAENAKKLQAALRDTALLSEGMLVTWALFAIADALWVKVLLGGK